MFLDTIFLSLGNIFLNHGIKMTGGGSVNGTPLPVTAFPTEGLMGIVEGINSFFQSLLSIFGAGV
jgi:hypothetical protein